MLDETRTHEEEALGRAYDARLMRRLLRYLGPYRWKTALAVGLLLLAALLELVGPWLTMLAIDRAIPQRDPGLLTLLAIAYFAALVLGFMLEYAQNLLTTWLGQKVMYDLRSEIFAHLQRLEIAFFDRNPVGRLMTRVTNDVEVLNELFRAGIVSVFGDIFTLLFIVGVLLLLDWQLALVSFAVLPLVALTAFVFRARVRDAYREIRVRLARINAFLQERLSGVLTVQIFGRESETSRRFREIDRQHLDAHLRSITYYALFFPVIELLTAVALALILVYGGTQILGGTQTVGVVAAFLLYARRFFRPIQDLAEKYNLLQGAMASSERIFNLLDTPPELGARVPTPLTVEVGPQHAASPAPPAPPGVPRREQAGRGEIEFRNVWFAYRRKGTDRRLAGAADAASAEPEWDWVLEDLSFRARPGERIAIVGHTGAGKTTIINLLMRFYEPQRGEILLDGEPIRSIPADRHRRRIGLVLQDIFLFTRDVAYNIHLGNDEIDEAMVRAAAEHVGVHDMVARLPRGYAEQLGERGASLSMGERQLLSFARALVRDPLVLVLDEATSSVDSELETRIEAAVDVLMRGRTALIIAHRLSTVQNADRILVLQRGRLREEGTHQELLQRRGHYARLYELQFATALSRAG